VLINLVGVVFFRFVIVAVAEQLLEGSKGKVINSKIKPKRRLAVDLNILKENKF
jgi:hypothetical protein